MGQEQSYLSHGGVAQVSRYKDNYENPIKYRSKFADGRTTGSDDDYKRHKARRSADSFKSDNSKDSSGYRSGSSGCELRSDISSKSDYYCTSLYKNDHYRDVSKDLYKPVKIPKEKRYKLQLFEVNGDDIKSARLKSYHSDSEKAKKADPAPKKTGIRNYTPKILSDSGQKKAESWI